MSPSDDLYQLIRSLSQHERGYFRKLARSESAGKDPEYLRLFDAIHKQKEYDEAALKAQFSKGRSSSQFSVAKNYLYDQLLKALMQFHARDSEYLDLFEALSKTEVLHNRGLYRQAWKMMKKARKLTGENNPSGAQLLIHLWERRLSLMDRTQKHRFAHVEGLREVETEQLKQLSLMNDFWSLLAQYDLMIMTHGYRWEPEQLAEGKALMATPQMALPPENLPYDAQILRLQLQVRHHYIHTELQEMTDVAAALVALIETRSEWKSWETFRYQDALVLLINGLISIRNYQEALDGAVRLMRSLPPPRRRPGKRYESVARRIIDLTLRAMAGLGRFDLGQDYLQTFPGDLLHYLDRNMTDGARVHSYPMIAWIYICNGDHATARKWLHPLLQVPPANVQFDFMLRARMLWLVLHFEAGEWAQIEPLTEAYRRFIQARKPLNPFDEALIRFFRAVARHTVPADRVEAARQFRMTMEKELELHPEKLTGAGYFDWMEWMLAIERDIPFAKILQEKLGTLTPELEAELREMKIIMPL